MPKRQDFVDAIAKSRVTGDLGLHLEEAHWVVDQLLAKRLIVVDPPDGQWAVAGAGGSRNKRHIVRVKAGQVTPYGLCKEWLGLPVFSTSGRSDVRSFVMKRQPCKDCIRSWETTSPEPLSPHWG